MPIFVFLGVLPKPADGARTGWCRGVLTVALAATVVAAGPVMAQATPGSPSRAANAMSTTSEPAIALARIQTVLRASHYTRDFVDAKSPEPFQQRLIRAYADGGRRLTLSDMERALRLDARMIQQGSVAQCAAALMLGARHTGVREAAWLQLGQALPAEQAREWETLLVERVRAHLAGDPERLRSVKENRLAWTAMSVRVEDRELDAAYAALRSPVTSDAKRCEAGRKLYRIIGELPPKIFSYLILPDSETGTLPVPYPDVLDYYPSDFYEAPLATNSPAAAHLFILGMQLKKVPGIFDAVAGLDAKQRRRFFGEAIAEGRRRVSGADALLFLQNDLAFLEQAQPHECPTLIDNTSEEKRMKVRLDIISRNDPLWEPAGTWMVYTLYAIRASRELPAVAVPPDEAIMAASRRIQLAIPEEERAKLNAAFAASKGDGASRPDPRHACDVAIRWINALQYASPADRAFMAVHGGY